MLRTDRVKLPKEEEKLIDTLRSEYVKAFQERGKHPGDFDANIQCLRELETVTHQLLDVQFAHAVSQTRELNKVNNPHFTLFRNFHRRKFLKETRMYQAVMDHFITPAREQIKESFRGDTRITYVGYEEDRNLLQANAEYKKTYTIVFADDTELKFNDLNRATLPQLRGQFDAKMRELDHCVRRYKC